jgi:hypothetical protein
MVGVLLVRGALGSGPQLCAVSKIVAFLRLRLRSRSGVGVEKTGRRNWILDFLLRQRVRLQRLLARGQVGSFWILYQWDVDFLRHVHCVASFEDIEQYGILARKAPAPQHAA